MKCHLLKTTHPPRPPIFSETLVIVRIAMGRHDRFVNAAAVDGRGRWRARPRQRRCRRQRTTAAADGGGGRGGDDGGSGQRRRRVATAAAGGNGGGRWRRWRRWGLERRFNPFLFLNDDERNDDDIGDDDGDDDDDDDDYDDEGSGFGHGKRRGGQRRRWCNIDGGLSWRVARPRLGGASAPGDCRKRDSGQMVKCCRSGYRGRGYGGGIGASPSSSSRRKAAYYGTGIMTRWGGGRRHSHPRLPTHLQAEQIFSGSSSRTLQWQWQWQWQWR